MKYMKVFNTDNALMSAVNSLPEDNNCYVFVSKEESDNPWVHYFRREVIEK